ncbi:putative multidrug resistance ABC transporter ATP-binding/permease protein YheI [Escherichia coli]|nr:putative multidrug resistance ABC transporter ATP-binding/permease protein YheI [Escherichia coli]
MANLLAIGGGSWMVVQGSLTLGQLTSFMMYLGLMIWPMLALAWMFNIVERGSAAYSRIRAMLAEAPVVNDGSEPVPEGRGELDVNIHQFTYPQTDHPALENVNFALNPVRCWVFAGRLVPAKVPCCRSFSVISTSARGYSLS